MFLVALNLFQHPSCPRLRSEQTLPAAVLIEDEAVMEIMTIDISTDLQTWIDQRLAEGRHVDAGDFIRDLIRRDQEGRLVQRPATAKEHRSD